MLGPGLGTAELIVIAVIALIVVGPKDLPVLLRKLGRFMGKVRAMATDFRASFDEMARQSELDELRKEVEALRSGSLSDKWTGDAKATMSDIESSLSASRPFAAAEAETLPAGSSEGMTSLAQADAWNDTPPPDGEGANVNGAPEAEAPRAPRPFAPAEPAPERSDA